MKLVHVLSLVLAVTLCSSVATVSSAATKDTPKLEIGSSPVRGPKTAKVTIYEFSDFQCPYCSQVEPTLDNVFKKYEGKVKIVYKFLPLESLHPDAMAAAQAGVAAQKQGKFWEMHDLLFSHQHELGKDDLTNYAKQLKLNVKKFQKDMDDPKTSQRIQGDMELAHAQGFSGTPAFLVNGQSVVGAAPQAEFDEAVDKALK